MASAPQPAPVSAPSPPRPGGLPQPTYPDDVVWRELEREFTRYDRQADRARVGYLALRMLALALGSTVTVLAAVDAPPAVTATLAALVVIAEGTLQLFQLHEHWISYRATAETLRREAFLYVAGMAPYDDPATRRARLAAALRDTTAAENNAWTSSMRQASSAVQGGTADRS